MYGDYTPGRFMWITENLQTFDPVPVVGRQGLFNVPDDILCGDCHLCSLSGRKDRLD